MTPLCRNNQRQIIFGAIMYKEDTRVGFPNLDDLSGNDGPVALSTLTNYLKKSELFMCPFVMRQRESDRPWFREKFVPELNSSFFRSNGNDYAYYDGLKLALPTNAILADRMAWTNRSAFNGGNPSHVRRINAAFGDGHAETLRPNKVVGAGYNPPWSAVHDPLLRP